MVSNYDHLRVVIATKLDYTKMGSGNTLFATKSGAMFQVYGAVKLVIVHPYVDHSSSSHGNMGSASLLLW